MILLAAILSLWPAPVIEFGPPKEPAPLHWKLIVSHCCGSMRPLFNGGETVHVSLPLPQERLTGKVISNGQALHMVTAENKRAVRTSGLSNRHSDNWTPRRQIQYVVRYAERK